MLAAVRRPLLVDLPVAPSIPHRGDVGADGPAARPRQCGNVGTRLVTREPAECPALEGRPTTREMQVAPSHGNANRLRVSAPFAVEFAIAITIAPGASV